MGQRPDMTVKTEAPAPVSVEAGLATALTFDDVLLVPQHSTVLPTQVDVSTRLTRNIRLHVPLLSAALDTVIETRLARPMALQGGGGGVHNDISIWEQATEADRDYRLKGLITVKDIQKAVKYPNACKDALGRLRCGAAIGVAKDAFERARALVNAGVDVLVIDTAHGHSQGVIDMVARVRREFP